MNERPEIGQRVRVLGNTGIPGVAGRVGIVAQHHEDGVAFVVQFAARMIEAIVCDPINVQIASTRASA